MSQDHLNNQPAFGEIVQIKNKESKYKIFDFYCKPISNKENISILGYEIVIPNYLLSLKAKEFKIVFSHSNIYDTEQYYSWDKFFCIGLGSKTDEIMENIYFHSEKQEIHLFHNIDNDKNSYTYYEYILNLLSKSGILLTKKYTKREETIANKYLFEFDVYNSNSQLNDILNVVNFYINNLKEFDCEFYGLQLLDEALKFSNKNFEEIEKLANIIKDKQANLLLKEILIELNQLEKFCYNEFTMINDSSSFDFPPCNYYFQILLRYIHTKKLIPIIPEWFIKEIEILKKDSSQTVKHFVYCYFLNNTIINEKNKIQSYINSSIVAYIKKDSNSFYKNIQLLIKLKHISPDILELHRDFFKTNNLSYDDSLIDEKLKDEINISITPSNIIVLDYSTVITLGKYKGLKLYDFFKDYSYIFWIAKNVNNIAIEQHVLHFLELSIDCLKLESNFNNDKYNETKSINLLKINSSIRYWEGQESKYYNENTIDFYNQSNYSSEDYIDDAFGGDEEAYWNID